MFQSL
jgi:hypothetical protein